MPWAYIGSKFIERGWAPTDTKARVPSDTYSTFLIVPVKFSSKKTLITP